MARTILRATLALLLLLSLPATLVLALRPAAPHPLLTFARWTPESGAFQPVVRDLDTGYEYLVLGGVWGETPIWSPDGNWMVYSQRLQGFSDVYLYNLRTARHLHIIRSLTPSRPVWSPALGASQVLIQRGSQAMRYFYVADVSPTMFGVMQFIDTGRFDVLWSPDGERIIYRAIDADDLLVSLSAEYFAAENRLQMREFTRTDRRMDILAGWMPDGHDLMIMSAPDSGGQPNLYSLDSSGTTTLLFENALAGTLPVWSNGDSDGALLAIGLVSEPTATTASEPALFLADSAGEIHRRLWDGIVGQLDWTPLTVGVERQALAFEVVQAENGAPFRGIVIYQQDSDTLTTLTLPGQFEVQPNWSVFKGRPFDGGIALLVEGLLMLGVVLTQKRAVYGRPTGSPLRVNCYLCIRANAKVCGK
ncbi:MAG: PD40 domain-containing protein [Burkholderiales bacterium]|nr:PD40 domain-containing protein [Anaerolineae bacterium]